jgi:hypothetical protein
VAEISLGDFSLRFQEGKPQSALDRPIVSSWDLLGNSKPGAKVFGTAAEGAKDQNPHLDLTEEQQDEYNEMIRQDNFLSDPLASEEAAIDACLAKPISP